MTFIQKLCMCLTATMMLTLSVACQHVTTLPDRVVTIAPTPVPVDPTLPPLPDLPPAAQLMMGFKKPAGHKHFVPEVVVRGPIDTTSAASVESIVEALNATHHDPQQDPVEAVVVIIDSPGGDVQSGTKIVEALQSLEMPAVCVVDSHAYSMGFYILEAACPVRLTTDRGSLMVHEPHIGGEVTVSNPTRWDLWNILEGLRVESESWLGVCARRMHMDPQVMLAKVRNVDWYMNSDEALRAGAVDAIVGNIDRDVVRPLQQELALPHRLGVPAALLRAPVEPPEAPLPAKTPQHRHDCPVPTHPQPQHQRR